MTTDYQRIILAGPTIDGPPGLPAEHVGVSDETLADFAAHCDPCPEHLVGIGYWPIQPADPPPEGKVAVARDRALVDGVLKWVEVLEDAPPPPFPTLKRKELRSALVSIGIFAADVTAKISEIADPTAREFALIDWEDTQDYERDHPLVDTLAVGFALPSEQVDALWRWAAGA